MSEETHNTQTVEGRRGFLAAMFGSALGIGLTGLGVLGGLWTAVAVRFLFPNTRGEPAERFRVGFPRDYPNGYVETRYKEPYGVWVVRAEYDGQQQIFALSTACTHLGCITLWIDGQRSFKCPCHGSRFSIEGINREGPAPRPLERYAICVAADGQLEVDKSLAFRQELGQWGDPESYVSV